VQIQRVTSMPEMPSAMLGLAAALTAGILALARLRAAFKIR
jgi:chemotaxis signal transduction protein